jgi:hypothetical protein
MHSSGQSRLRITIVQNLATYYHCVEKTMVINFYKPLILGIGTLKITCCKKIVH